MASQISVEPAVLKDQAKAYLTAHTDIENAIQKVKTTNGQIASEWKGEAFSAYLAQFDQTYKAVQKFEALLDSINKQLNKYADTVQARDTEDKKAFGLK
jgi:WXG100 family type VII secretion target